MLDKYNEKRRSNKTSFTRYRTNLLLGGHICVQCDDTSTHYINPINQINDPMTYESKNDVGKVSIFPNNIPHYTDIQKSDKERITIAFDLMIENPNKDNYIRLI